MIHNFDYTPFWIWKKTIIQVHADHFYPMANGISSGFQVFIFYFKLIMLGVCRIYPTSQSHEIHIVTRNWCLSISPILHQNDILRVCFAPIVTDTRMVWLPGGHRSGWVGPPFWMTTLPLRMSHILPGQIVFVRESV